MVSLRCTAKLLERLGISKPGEPPEPTAALGDWCANIIFTPQGHYVLCVSERSLLPVMLSARDLGSLVPRRPQQETGEKCGLDPVMRLDTGLTPIAQG